MREDCRKWALDEEIAFYEGLGLSVGFVPLYPLSEPLTVKCPLCGLVMLSIPNKYDYMYCCPECGILG